MKPKVRTVMLLLGALSVLGLGWLWFRASFEKVSRRVWVGYQGEARSNQYLAAERLLDRLGLEARSVEALQEGQQLPSPDGVLLIPGSRVGLGEQQGRALASWIAGGGHLIATLPRAREAGSRDDTLLQALGVQVRRAAPADADAAGAPDTGAPDTEAPVSEDQPAAGSGPAHQTAGSGSGAHAPPETPAPPVPTVDETEQAPHDVLACDGALFVPLTLTLPGGDELQVTAAPTVGELTAVAETGSLLVSHRLPGRIDAFALQYQPGAGLLTLLASTAFLHNGCIGKADNAALLWRLVTWGGRTGPVTIVSGSGVPPLWRLIAAHGWPVLLSAALLLLLWLWSRAWRSRPIQRLPQARRRGIMEHVRATGWYLWQQRQAGRLLEAVAADVQERAARRTPHWHRLPPAEQHRRLSALTGLPLEQIEQAMSDRPLSGQAGFARAVVELERISRKL